MSISNRDTAFPKQKIAMRSKDTQWKEDSIDAIIAREDSNLVGDRTQKEEMQIAYDLYNGIFNEEDLKYVTNPYKVDEGFPASPHNFNIIRPKINLLEGEETKRPFNVMVTSTSHESASHLQDKAKEMLTQYVIDEIGAQLQGEEGDKDNSKLNEILTYITRKYYSPSEKMASNSLKYLQEKLYLKHEFFKAWKDALIAGREVYYVGILNGEPVLERINPLYFSCDDSPEVEFIEDGDWALYHTEMTASAIYDRFFDIMEESELNQLLDMFDNNGVGGKDRLDRVSNKPISWRTINGEQTGSDQYDDNTVDVYHAVWKSYKKVGFLTYLDDDGNEQVEMVDETYKADPDEIIEWEWIPEVWEGYRIGDDLYIGIEPVANQNAPADEPHNVKLPYTGVSYSNTNSIGKSLVQILEPYQKMYITIWYKLELAIARDKGKIINMDITQIPKSMGMDVNKWMHYLTALGVNFVNPYEEGWDIPGREGGKQSGFNQFGNVDLTMSNVIAEYIGLMDKIEELAGELSGISRQRQGAVTSSELVGNVQRSVIQSSHITEPLFWMHNQAKRRALTLLLNTAKVAWANSGKEKLHYVLDDVTRIFMNINDDFLYSDFDVFLTDSTKEQQNIEALKTLMQPAMQNGASLLDVAEIMTLDNMSEIKERLEIIEEKRQRIQEQQAEADRQVQMQIQEMASQDKAEENRIKEEDSIRKAETQIQVALIGADQNEGNDSISLDAVKLDLQRSKQENETRLKEDQLRESKRATLKAEEQKQQEIEIKRKQANKPTATAK
jgi:predicted hydrocarbon binding protein